MDNRRLKPSSSPAASKCQCINARIVLFPLASGKQLLLFQALWFRKCSGTSCDLPDTPNRKQRGRDKGSDPNWTRALKLVHQILSSDFFPRWQNMISKMSMRPHLTNKKNLYRVYLSPPAVQWKYFFRSLPQPTSKRRQTGKYIRDELKHVWISVGHRP